MGVPQGYIDDLPQTDLDAINETYVLKLAGMGKQEPQRLRQKNRFNRFLMHLEINLVLVAENSVPQRLILATKKSPYVDYVLSVNDKGIFFIKLNL